MREVVMNTFRMICMLGLGAAAFNVYQFAFVKWEPMWLALQLISAALLIPAVIRRDE